MLGFHNYSSIRPTADAFVTLSDAFARTTLSDVNTKARCHVLHEAPFVDLDEELAIAVLEQARKGALAARAFCTAKGASPARARPRGTTALASRGEYMSCHGIARHADVASSVKLLRHFERMSCSLWCWRSATRRLVTGRVESRSLLVKMYETFG